MLQITPKQGRQAWNVQTSTLYNFKVVILPGNCIGGRMIITQPRVLLREPLLLLSALLHLRPMQ